MLLIKVFLVAFALAGGKKGGHHGGRPRVPDECKNLEAAAYGEFLINDDNTGLLDAVASGTMYCTIDAKYAEWPACPPTEEDPTEAPIDGQRRNLGKKGGHGGGRKDKPKYNRGRFTMGGGTSSFVQVEYNSEEASTAQCYFGDEFRFNYQGSQLDDDSVDALVGRRLLKKGGGKPKVTATLDMTQEAGTFDGSCDSAVPYQLTCSIKRDYLQVVNGVCTAVAVSCETPKDSDSDTRVKMTCYQDENDVKGWDAHDQCSADDDDTDGNQVINLSVDDNTDNTIDP